MSHNGASNQRRGGRGTLAGRQRRRMRPMVLVLEDRWLLSMFTVNSTLDNGSNGTLRWAVGQANSTVGADTIDFDSTVFNTPQTITLTGGLLALTDTATTTTSGPGADLPSISGNDASRVFDIEGGSVALSGLTITGGSADSGGGLFNNGGTTTLTNCTVSGNFAASNGGGLDNLGGTVAVQNCSFTSNGAGRYSPLTLGQGGAIENTGTMVVSDTRFTGNQSFSGGGIDNQGR